jgi:hypothetical protein
MAQKQKAKKAFNAKSEVTKLKLETTKLKSQKSEVTKKPSFDNIDKNEKEKSKKVKSKNILKVKEDQKQIQNIL